MLCDFMHKKMFVQIAPLTKAKHRPSRPRRLNLAFRLGRTLWKRLMFVDDLRTSKQKALAPPGQS
ncbi:hypothetical protein PspTeo4_19288 [Pseudomonas sp. Teo4]|nr:hypothetical protein [Pseudomonas sp. Teo4]